jgi:hypothetical protein
MLLWWRRSDALLKARASGLLRKLVAELNRSVTAHFQDPEAAEEIIRLVFIEYGRAMEYGKAVHAGIRAERKKRGRGVPRDPARLSAATAEVLRRIRTPSGASTSADVNAVLPLVVFYAGYVVTFGRAAGFNDAAAESGVTGVLLTSQ